MCNVYRARLSLPFVLRWQNNTKSKLNHVYKLMLYKIWILKQKPLCADVRLKPPASELYLIMRESREYHFDNFLNKIMREWKLESFSKINLRNFGETDFFSFPSSSLSPKLLIKVPDLCSLMWNFLCLDLLLWKVKWLSENIIECKSRNEKIWVSL